MNIQFTWSDRRPIGKLNIGAAAPFAWIWDQYKNDPYQGETQHELMRSYMDRSLPVLKDINAQGIIVWDCEGMKYPQPTSYIGSPDKAKQMNPTFDYDWFFAVYRNAGYKIGVTLRPQEFNLVTKKQVESADPIATLVRKAKYANKTWGATIFYIDSNVLDPPWIIYPGMIYAWLQRALPGCLFIPEHKDPENLCHLWAAGWRELTTQTGTPADVLAKIPDAFSVVNLSNPKAPMAGREAELMCSMARGDIMLVDSWWYSDRVKEVVKLVAA